MSDDRRAADRVILEAVWGGFYRCPTTGRIIEALAGDDKVICGCRRSNPQVPEERTEATGVHIIRFLVRVSTDDYLDQQSREEDDPNG